MDNNKLQTIMLYMTADDLDNVLRQTYPEQFKNMPIKLTGVELNEESDIIVYRYTVCSDSEFVESLKGCKIKIQPTLIQD